MKKPMVTKSIKFDPAKLKALKKSKRIAELAARCRAELDKMLEETKQLPPEK